ncbi:protein-tyrosine phosphatase-like protein [Hygrophoropsis aurantiaca]|uniref:Protein-tyrosine phosphatase-like protein n=1 Tax=Hygrophoropsis aurantiaca TaxID=72124 RepID=A0ACB8ASB8_9AGAM|nr:protein-tyrosine phosphatase-like protein [Hygrophoropsis aurantiaca]
MELEPLDPAYVAEILSRPPFVQISGVQNVRDLGSYPTATPNAITKPGYAYRAAEISGITDEGIEQMNALGISTIFDFRSDTEIQKYNSPIPSVRGVEILRTPVFKNEDYSPEALAKKLQLYASGTSEAFMILYSQILDHGGPAFESILRHVRDRPTSPFLFHCTAGKDRTGVMAAILLKLAGVDDQTISHDYSLTRIGREPDRERIMKRLTKEPLFASDNQAAMRMFTSRFETMQTFLSLLETKYGGVEAYINQYTGLTDDDIVSIRNNLLVPTKSRM